MRFLLDTHALLWLLAERARQRSDTRSARRPRTDVFVSVVSAWEIAAEVALGKLDVPPDVRSWLPAELAAVG